MNGIKDFLKSLWGKFLHNDVFMSAFWVSMLIFMTVSVFFAQSPQVNLWIYFSMPAIIYTVVKYVGVMVKFGLHEDELTPAERELGSNGVLTAFMFVDLFIALYYAVLYFFGLQTTFGYVLSFDIFFILMYFDFFVYSCIEGKENGERHS